MNLITLILLTSVVLIIIVIVLTTIVISKKEQNLKDKYKSYKNLYNCPFETEINRKTKEMLNKTSNYVRGSVRLSKSLIFENSDIELMKLNTFIPRDEEL